MKKKGLVLAIVIAMLTSIIPSFAFATENNSSDEAITKAKEKYLQAEAEYKQGPAKFLDDRMCEKHKESHSKSGYEKKLAADNDIWKEEHGKVQACYNAFLNDPKKDWREDRWFTFDNLRLQVTWLNELNELRASDDNKKFSAPERKSPIRYICPELVMESMMSSLVGYYQRETFHETSHLLGSDGSIYVVEAGENLAWSYKDPFDGWYRQEKNGMMKDIVKVIAIKT